MHRVSFLLLSFALLYISQSFAAEKSTIKQISVSDFQIVVSDSADSHDVAEGRKYTSEHPNAVDSKVTVEPFHHLTINFKVKNQATSKSIQPHQAFVSIGNARDEVVYPAIHDGKQYAVSVSVEEIVNRIRDAREASVAVIIGDVTIATPIHWKVATLSVSLANGTSVTPVDPYAPKPVIEHVFRKAEKRPPATISFAFTLAVLSPALFLFVGLIRVGANIRNFPFGSGFIWAIGFQVCLGAILALFGLYWLSLNMVQTLKYLGFLSIPTVIFAQKTLNHLAAQNKIKQA